jgi:hypothetical protein
MSRPSNFSIPSPPVSSYCGSASVWYLSLPLKIRTRGKKRDALIHDGLADPKVVVDPLLDAGGFGELVGFYAGTVSTRVSLSFCMWVRAGLER